MLFETLEDKPNSKPWHPLVILSLCVLGAFAARFLIHHSLAALKNALRTAPPHSTPSLHVGEGAPNR